jgi:RHS repeat-associated protein
VFFAAFGAFADVKTENLGQLVREYAVKGNQKRWQIDQFGNKTTYKYNSMGQLVTTQIDGKTNMEYRYSKDGRLGTIRDELGRITKHKYDIFGRLTELVNPLGQTSKSIYDAYGRLVEQTGAGKYPLQYQYTPFGEISSYVDKNASTTRFEYDNSGRLIKLICPNGSAIEYKYDKFGRLVVKTEADRVTGYFYSERGNLIKVHISQGLNQHHTTQMEYNDRGQMVSISAEGLTTRFAYDHFGRKLLEESPMGTFTYMYNEKGLLSARQAQFKGSNEKFITNYKYDNFNRVVEVSSPAGSYKYIWGKNNKIAAIEFGNGQKIVYSYDKADRLTGKRLGDKVLVAYTYDALDRRIAATYLGVSWKYAYDQYSQLIKAESSLNEKYEYDYDAIGNRTKAITLASTQKFTFNNLNQINTNGYVYDAWGNMVKAPGIKYKYDLKNRLVEYKKGGLTISYTYDALDQRINAVQNGKRTDFLMSGMVEYARKAGNKAQYHTLGLDLQNSLDRTSAVGAILASSDAFGSGFNYLYDGSGNVIASCDNGGVIKDKLTYSPFGRQTSGAKLLFTFSTKAVDQSNMSYYGYRFYSTDLGRWNKKDPLLDIDFYSTHLTGKPIFYEAAKIIKNNFNKYQNILTLHQFLISKISTLSRLQFEKLQINHLNNRQYAFVNNNTINRGNFKSI